METNKSKPDILYTYPKEVLDINWYNTTEELVKEGYKVWAVNYDKWAQGSQQDSSPVPPGYVGHIECANAFNAAAKEVYGDTDKKNLKLLDLGCGTGLVGKILKEKFGFDNLVGLDVSEDMLEIAREKAIYNKFIYSYVTNERVDEIDNAEFDGVLASAVITPGQIKPSAFDEIIRWIKPGGIMCFNCRTDGYESEEYGYKAKFENFEIQKRWKLISNSDGDYYGGNYPAESGPLTSRVLVYRMLPF
ncbi:Methyltransferase domain [Desmophyllum pertusum]|uniref:Methyltransferase domain n=1 Tax=Desmophyllum pertusum TaxID=174260 RepID=A0A9W9Z3U2_9CNID|nr:Methyltransferase domain [Desmophyllum pertusum]